MDSVPATESVRDDLVTGRLRYGVPYEGKRHYDFAIRIPTMGENVEALESLPGAINARIEIAMYALCMERLGEIPSTAISLELLLKGLYPSDVDLIAFRIDDAKKKHLSTTDEPDSTES